VAAKQRILEDNLDRIGKIRPQTVLSPILGPDWRYRERARLSARYVEKKARLLLGFHERRSSFVADMGSCEVLPARISRLLEPLKELLNSLCIRERVPQVELAIGDAVDVLVLRILEYPASDDAEKLRKFAEQYQIKFYLQPGGPDTAVAFHPKEAPVLQYRIPDFDLTFPFHPTDFTQVNHAINRVLVRRAITLLDPQAGERIGDFFCGLGNFSLAIARRGAKVFGIDGNARLALRAGETASLNGLGKQCRFVDRDLFKITVDEWKEIAPFDRILLDPPRDGAMELVKVLGEAAPARIVYVSCNPATLARDAGVLVNMHAYQLSAAGVINMFPHTSHVESIAVFDR
jgi:23S rRNA (uracil1939-C5)-methyltransferase